MVTKYLPIPPQDWTRVTLNPRVRRTTTRIVAAHYAVDRDGVEWICPYCLNTVTDAPCTAYLRVNKGDFKGALRVHPCPRCDAEFFTVSLFDLLKHFEIERNHNG